MVIVAQKEDQFVSHRLLFCPSLFFRVFVVSVVLLISVTLCVSQSSSLSIFCGGVSRTGSLSLFASLLVSILPFLSLFNLLRSPFPLKNATAPYIQQRRRRNEEETKKRRNSTLSRTLFHSFFFRSLISLSTFDPCEKTASPSSPRTQHRQPHSARKRQSQREEKERLFRHGTKQQCVVFRRRRWHGASTIRLCLS